MVSLVQDIFSYTFALEKYIYDYKLLCINKLTYFVEGKTTNKFSKKITKVTKNQTEKQKIRVFR